MSKSNRAVPARNGRDPKKESLWRDRLNRQSRSGLSVRAFCERDNLKEAAFYFWRREIRHRDAQAAAGHSTSPAFVELVPAPAPAPVTVAGSAASAIELLLPLDRRLLIRNGFDVSLLRRVLAVLAPVSPSNPEGGPC
jgi:transposase-like protein